MWFCVHEVRGCRSAPGRGTPYKHTEGRKTRVCVQKVDNNDFVVIHHQPLSLPVPAPAPSRFSMPPRAASMPHLRHFHQCWRASARCRHSSARPWRWHYLEQQQQPSSSSVLSSALPSSLWMDGDGVDDRDDSFSRSIDSHHEAAPLPVRGRARSETLAEENTRRTRPASKYRSHAQTHSEENTMTRIRCYGHTPLLYNKEATGEEA